MILTEEEAKTKRCQESFGSQPNAPFGSQHESVTSGFAQPMSPTHCIGSACMAWRWGKSTQSTCYYPEGTKATDPETWRGYCGKVGV
jgi:hypothetical protein